jgi:exo-beta-1,3-glucanase (GH17 family)/cellulose synthase/poly-beta-1,6-N-acetylglucosamine synthase-like glycosyltransferase
MLIGSDLTASATAKPGARHEPPAHALRRVAAAVAIAAFVVALNLLLWFATHRPIEPPDWQGKIRGFAFSAFQRDQSPLDGTFPTQRQISDDLRLLARHGERIRTYASAESAAIPRLATANGLRVTAGAWLDRRLDNNTRELDALIEQARTFAGIDRVIVGNESVLRSDLTPRQLIPYLDRARKALKIPVSTAEPWHVWLKHPELAEHVDFITIHLLPYWEGVPVRRAVADVIARYDQVQRRFPEQRIVIGEVGWPSNGDRFRHARPSRAEQARFLREFFRIAQQRQLDYYVMEAFDQPWKESGEGRVGAYWGLFDAAREAKFPLAGPVARDPEWLGKAVLASVLAFLPMLFFCLRFAEIRAVGRATYCVLVQAGATLLVWSIGIPFDFYLDAFDWAMLVLLLPAQLAILAILLCNGFEFVEALWLPRWRRGAALRTEDDARSEWPLVSIHLACHDEPPEMVIATLDSLAALDYPRYEVLVIDNNTASESTWRPVQQRCRELGSRFRFYHLSAWPGFKAGALNFALGETASEAAIVAVVDADYVVRPDWLRRLVGHFDHPATAIVQCPQAHRAYANNAFRRISNWEYEGFFRIGMHHRNERNAIIQHGTMTLIRRSALVASGGWAEWCITEDAELGLRLLDAGHDALYVDEPMGRGLTPADFAAYKSQRFRWAFGAMQVLRAHWRSLTRRGRLSLGQRFHFLTGWFGWFADALHLVFTLAAIVWSLGMLYWPENFSLPLSLFLFPVLGFVLCKVVFGIVTYRARVPCSWRDTLGAALASMALSHAIARGVLRGLSARRHPFTRTAKQRRSGRRPSAFSAVREETLLLAALGLSSAALLQQFGWQWPEAKLWIAILAAQALPYLAAVSCAAISALAPDAEADEPEAAQPDARTALTSTS